MSGSLKKVNKILFLIKYLFLKITQATHLYGKALYGFIKMRKVFKGRRDPEGRSVKYILKKDKPPLGSVITGVQYGKDRPILLTQALKKRSIKKAYLHFLRSLEWDIYFTFTPSFKLSNNSAHKAINRIKQQFEERNLSFYLFYAIEPFQIDGYHAHGVLKLNSDIDISAKILLLKSVYRIATGTKYKIGLDSYISPYNDSNNGIEYICKRIFHPNSIYDLLYSKEFELPQSVLMQL